MVIASLQVLIQFLHFMDIRRRISNSVVIFISGLLTINGTCNKSGFDCSIVKNNFELPVRITPDYEILQIDDSLTIIIDESSTFVDLQTNQSVNFNNAGNLGSALSFMRYDSLNKTWVNAANLFSFYLIKGKISNPVNEELYRAFLFSENNNRYYFNLIIKPKESGLFQMIFSNSNNTYRESDPCDKANFTINLKETNHNRHLVGYTGENLPGGDFFFVVK